MNDDWDQSPNVSLNSAAQQQMMQRFRDKGFGITSLAQHAGAVFLVFLGRTVQCLGLACRDVTPTLHAALGQAGALKTSSLLK